MRIFKLSMLILFFMILGSVIRGELSKSELESKNMENAKILNENLKMLQIEQKIHNCNKLLSSKNKSREDLPYFIKIDLKEFDISSKDLDLQKWKKFLNLYTERYAPKTKQSSKYFSWEIFLDNHQITNVKDLDFFIKQGFDISKPDNAGTSFISHYLTRTKAFDKDVLDKMLKMGAKLSLDEDVISTIKAPTSKTEELLMWNKYIKIAQNDALCAALINTNKDVARDFIDYLDSKGVPIANQNYGFNLRIIAERNDERQNKYYQKMLKDINPNLPAFLSFENEKVYQQIIEHNADDKTLDLLLSQDLQVNKTNSGKNILHYASKNSTISASNYQKLIDLGVDINAQTKKKKRTPLMSAIKNENLLQVKLLLENGALINLKDNENQTAINYIKNIKNADIKAKMELLFKNNP